MGEAADDAFDQWLKRQLGLYRNDEDDFESWIADPAHYASREEYFAARAVHHETVLKGTVSRLALALSIKGASRV